MKRSGASSRAWFGLGTCVAVAMGSAVRVITQDFARVGGGRVGSFASLRVVSSRSLVSLLWLRGCMFACCRYLWYLWYLRMCMFAGISLVAWLHVCGSLVSLVSLVSSHVHVCRDLIGCVVAYL